MKSSTPSQSPFFARPAAAESLAAGTSEWTPAAADAAIDTLAAPASAAGTIALREPPPFARGLQRIFINIPRAYPAVPFTMN